MASDAQIKASVKYNKSRDNIMLRPTKEQGEKIRNAAKSSGKSVQRFILDILEDVMECHA